MDVTLPNGIVVRGIPDGTNKYAIMEKAIAKGLATPEDFGQQSANPTEGMSGVEKFRAGWGKSAVDLGRGAGQWVGLTSREDVARSRERDAPLMQSGVARTGNILGSVANVLPTALIPGANTVAGATAIGAGVGALQPSTSTGETLGNTALGGAAGGGSILAGRLLGSLWNGGKALVEPFLKGGQDRIAARTLTEFAGGTDDAARALQNIARNAPDTLPGMQPTTAELAQNAGLSQLERTLRNNPETLPAISDRLLRNRNAILGAVDDIAGDAAERQWTGAARTAVTEDLYGLVNVARVESDDALNTLLSRPSLEKAWSRAASLARERGQELRVGVDLPEQVVSSKILNEFGRPFQTTIPAQRSTYSGRALHFLKMAMDDLADAPPATSGIGKNEASALGSTRSALVGWIEKNVPEYRLAREWFARMSRPINQMEVGQAFADKLKPALSDYGAMTRLRPESFAQALRNGDATAARALGRSSASISDVMNPLQMDKLEQVGRMLARRVNADELGRAVGSNTGQNVVSQNFLRQLLGPLGLPESTMQRAAQSTIGQSVMRPAQFAGALGEQKVMERLAEAALDPVLAQKLLKQGVTPEMLAIIRYQALLGPTGAAIGTAATN